MKGYREDARCVGCDIRISDGYVIGCKQLRRAARRTAQARCPLLAHWDRGRADRQRNRTDRGGVNA